MSPMEPAAKKPSWATGLRAMFAASLGARGAALLPHFEGSQLHRLLLVTLAIGPVLCSALAFAAPPALAAAPEAPVVEAPTEVRASTANLHGRLNPGKEGEPGAYELDKYEFVYRPSAQNQCTGTGEVLTAAGLSLGAGKEDVSQGIEGLTANTTYAVCVVVHNQAGTEAAVSPPTSFTTALPPETPEGEQGGEITATTARLKGVLNPKAKGEPGYYRFSYAPSTTGCTGGESQSTPPEPGAPATGHQAEAVEAVVTNLLPATTYTFCLIAANGAGEEADGAPVRFTTLTAIPAVSGETATAVGASTANVHAEIGPGGLATGYYVEYISDAQFLVSGWPGAERSPTSDAELPATSTRVAVGEVLGDLQPETTYRFRFLATNARGSVPGTEATFTTASAQVSALPDQRAYELVSTSGNTGEPYGPTAPEYGFASYSRQLFQAAFDGEAVAYLGEPPAVGGNGAIGNGLGNEWLAKRSPEGWKTEVITPAASAVGTVYQAFSSDLSSAILETNLQPPLTPDSPAGCQVLYSRANGGNAYTPLTSAGTSSCAHPLFAGAAAGESEIIFQTESALTANAKEATEVPEGHERHGGSLGKEGGEPCTFGCNLYAAEGGQLRLVNVLPGAEGKTVPNATFGGYAGENANKTNFSNAISGDGSRIFWTDTQAGPNMEHVYVLENGTVTVQVSGAGPAEYWTASSDGHYAYYTEGQQLWRFDTSSNTREALTGGESKVQGVIGVNATGEDGAYLYFVAETAEGEPGLYLRHAGVTTFIAALSPQDNRSFASTGATEAYGDWVANLGDRTAEVTPDGHSLVFQSVRPITGYDNIDLAGEGNSVSEVFVYAADTAQLSCASCSPTGVRPQISQQETQTLLPISSESDTSMRRWISVNGGRVFYDTKQPLVPQDTNGGTQDVYEWETEGEGTCTKRPNNPRLNRGCVFLLSGGNSEDLSFLIDADASGENVFFTHRGPLGQIGVPASQSELYDARVNGGFSPVSSGCKGSECQSAPSPPPPLAMPSSAGASGPGNFPGPSVTSKAKTAAQLKAEKLTRALTACKKDRSKRRRIKCESSARAKYGAKNAKRASHKRRPKS